MDLSDIALMLAIAALIIAVVNGLVCWAMWRPRKPRPEWWDFQ